MMSSLNVTDYFDFATHLFESYWPIISGAVPLVGAIIFTINRRPKSTKQAKHDIDRYFTETGLLKPPTARPAYSDRMAYVLAEMSDLAYYQFEGKGGLVEDAVQRLTEGNVESMDIRKFLDTYTNNLISGRNLSLATLEKILENSGFSLVEVIDIQETQGFVCKRTVQGEQPFLVLAFRGTEKKISDWLTDARCVPTIEGSAKIHTGFLDAFSKKTDSKGRTVEDTVKDILGRQESKDDQENPLPLFITGHSLGGALALLATKRVAPDINGACYTFGAPRIGNYEFFRYIKTPVFRVVNSSDIVPRVPPGALMLIITYIFRMMAWLTQPIPLVSSIFNKIEEWLDKLNGYRHHGDLRYLTDVAGGKFDTVRLLPNPSATDRIIWFINSIQSNLFIPVKNHGMRIYRKKLASIANNRNQIRHG